MVQASVYFHLLNPLVMAVFAVGFMLIYRSDRTLDSARLFSVAFGIGSFAFGVVFLTRIYLQSVLIVNLCNVVILFSAATIAYGITRHLSHPVRKEPFVIATLAVIAVWVTLVMQSPPAATRIGLTYLGTAALLCFSLPALWAKRRQSPANILLVLIVAFAAQALTLGYTSTFNPNVPTHSIDGLETVELVAANIIAALFSISIAATLLFSLGHEIVHRLHTASGTDFLSGVLNRRGFQEAAELALARARRSPVSVSLILADLDHFKKINDTFGHATGDKVISEFAQLLASMSRTTDICGRIGGEEFAIFLWNCDERGARLFAEAARETWKHHSITLLPSEESSTASFGIATVKGPDATLSNLTDLADAALYEAKNMGRDRTQSQTKVAEKKADAA